MKYIYGLLLPLFLAIAVIPATSQAQDVNQHPRSGFWINVGVGAGTLGCQDCDERDSGFSGSVALGGTVSNTSIRPFLSFYGMTIDGGDANVAQAGVGVTFH